MNKKFIYSLCAAAFLMTGCDYNEDNFPGYDEGGRPTDVAKIVYTLTDADYDAMGKDVKKNKYFSADAMPDQHCLRILCCGCTPCMLKQKAFGWRW